MVTEKRDGPEKPRANPTLLNLTSKPQYLLDIGLERVRPGQRGFPGHLPCDLGSAASEQLQDCRGVAPLEGPRCCRPSTPWRAPGAADPPSPGGPQVLQSIHHWLPPHPSAAGPSLEEKWGLALGVQTSRSPGCRVGQVLRSGHRLQGQQLQGTLPAGDSPGPAVTPAGCRPAGASHRPYVPGAVPSVTLPEATIQARSLPRVLVQEGH